MTQEATDALANALRKVVDFVEANSRGTSLQGVNRDVLARFIVFCHMTGKLALFTENAEIKCVIVYHPEVFEHMELRHEQGKPIFEWEACKRGDCLFVGDVIGERKYVAMLYQKSIEKFPHLSITPIYTIRRGRLHRLTKKTLERLANAFV